MLGSSNNFFFQSPIILNAKRKDVQDLLFIKVYSEKQIDIYLQAFDYFIDKPKDFDGATGVNDLIDIPGSFGYDGLDLKAMLHDLQWIAFKAASSFKYKRMTDEIFHKGIVNINGNKKEAEKRLKGLSLLSIPLVIRSNIKYGKMSATQMLIITKQYNILMNETV
jgi:hypothetical protein